MVLSCSRPTWPRRCGSGWATQPSVAKRRLAEVDPALLVQESVTCVVQVQGKVRARLEVAPDIAEDELRALALADEAVQRAWPAADPQGDRPRAQAGQHRRRLTRPTGAVVATPITAPYGCPEHVLGGGGRVGSSVAGLVEGLSEGIHFAKKAELDINAVIDTISKGAAQSWQMENRYKTMNEGKFDFGFAVEWMRKDLSICISEARRNGASLPVTSSGGRLLFGSRDNGRPPVGYVQSSGAARTLTPAGFTMAVPRPFA